MEINNLICVNKEELNKFKIEHHFRYRALMEKYVSYEQAIGLETIFYKITKINNNILSIHCSDRWE